MSGKNAVLVVDDDSTTTMLLRHYLEGIGVTTFIASDGVSALKIIQTYSSEIGLVLLDIAMPHMNGYELCKIIRSDPELTGLKVIAVTARSSPELPFEAEEAGIDQVITKPFKPTAIREVLEEYGLIAPK